MKYLKHTILACLFLLTGAFLFILNLGNGGYESYERRFVFIPPIQWSLAANGIKEADQEFQTNTRLIGSASLDLERQISQLENAIRTKVDGIITAAASDSEELRAVIQEAEEQGIPVVLIDGDLEDCGRDCYIGTDNTAAGRLAGQDMYDGTGGTAKIAVVVSELSAPNQQERLDGFREVIEQYSGMEIVEVLECHSDILEIQEKIPELLEEYPDINAFFLAEGFGGIALGGILEELEWYDTEPVVVAFDAAETTLGYVEDGTYYSVIAQQMGEEGYLAVQMLCRILDGEETEEIIYTGAISVTAENFEEYQAEANEEVEWYAD